MKKIRKVLGVLLVCFIVLSSGIFGGKAVNAATVGQALLQKEDGWNRYDDSDQNLSSGYIGNKWVQGSNDATAGRYNKTLHYTAGAIGDRLQFNFIGSKLRIIGDIYKDKTSDVSLMIDGQFVKTFSPYSATDGIPCALLVEVTGLSFGEHYVQVINNTIGNFLVDAIDIDSTGSLKPYNVKVKAITLDKSNLNFIVGQTSTEIVNANVYPQEAINKNVTWTIDDSLIASIAPNGLTCSVTGLKEGITTLRATTQDGNLVATCTITVSPNPARAILTIYLSNQTSRQYDLSAAELNAFLAWYDNRAVGIGSVRYGFSKPLSSPAFGKRTEYVVYDKIVAFDIDDYTSQITK